MGSRIQKIQDRTDLGILRVTDGGPGQVHTEATLLKKSARVVSSRRQTSHPMSRVLKRDLRN